MSSGSAPRVPVTLVDVARSVGVHPSTASRALNTRTRGKVSPSTVALVLDAAARMGYQPNSLARGLRMSRTFTVGMLVPDLNNPLFPPIVRGIEDRLRESGFTLVIANTDNDDVNERSLFETMVGRRVDGLILATARREYPLIEEIRDAGLAAVLVNRTTDRTVVPAVLGDDHSGIGQAVRHLVELGHTKIAHVGGTQAVSTGIARYHSFVSAMMMEGLEPDPARIVFAEWFREDRGAEAFSRLLDSGVDFTAVVCGNDLIALGCYDVMRERGIRCPEDISVVGYNDIPFNDKFTPPLTSVRLPHYHIGYRAAGLLVELMQDMDAPPGEVRLTPELVVRGSTMPPRS